MEPDVQAYIGVMEEIKRRAAVVHAFLRNLGSTLYRATTVESAVLQVRMITELIALATLAANKSIFEEHEKKFEKHWHPSQILRDVEQLNPQFYPHPVVEIVSDKPGISRSLVSVKDGFLRREDLIEVHGRCGNILHAKNPYGKKADYEDRERIVPAWMERIKRLLNSHLVRLLDGDTIYLVHMREERDDKVRMYAFQRKDT